MQTHSGYMPISLKYRRGILLVSCSMVVLCLILFVSYTFTSLRQYYLEREYDSLGHTLESLDVLFNTAESYSKAILSDDVVQDTLAYPTDDRNVDTITMRKQISRYMISSKYIEAVPIYAMNGRVYDSGGISSFPNNLKAQLAVNEAAWQPYHETSYIRSNSMRPSHVFSLIRPIYDYRSTDKIGVIEVCIPESVITDSFLLSGGNRSHYLTDEDNVIIAHPDKTLLRTKDAIPLLGDSVPHVSDVGYTISRRNSHTGWYLKSTVPNAIIYGPIYRMLTTMIAAGFIVIGISVAVSAKTASTVTRGITQLTASVRKIDGLKARVAPVPSRDETAILCDEFNLMLEKLEQASAFLVEEQRQKRTFQLELLQQQINPHFLYNTLENISSLAELGYSAEAVGLVDNLASFYRGVLSKGNVVIPLRSEIEIANNYLEVLKIRSHSNFTYLFDVPGELSNNVCIKLLLQPILENSIYHGFEGGGEGYHIVVSAREEEGSVLLTVTDNGKGADPDDLAERITEQMWNRRERKSYGLANIHQRLALYFGAGYGLSAGGGKGIGTSICLRLPREEWRTEKEDAHDKNNIG